MSSFKFWLSDDLKIEGEEEQDSDQVVSNDESLSQALIPTNRNYVTCFWYDDVESKYIWYLQVANGMNEGMNEGIPI